ncbi:protein kinase family protein [Streptomyces niveiscabiei]|uniref:Aminoglycoside phosphotransferase n=1 Tax=Streptomyces niveiscabiei TaxID=164115 RepID=A0ABW9I4Q9_9ACTN
MYHWDGLPPAARRAVEERTGRVREFEPRTGRLLAVTVRTAASAVFVKGAPDDYLQVHTHNREAAVNPWLPIASPRLKWRVRAGGWDLLGYDHAPGHPADLTPGSPDLPLVARALQEVHNTPRPGVELRNAENRWGSWVRDADPQLLAGDTLLHTTLTPDDLLVGDRAHLVGWSQATVGAAWIDPAVLILRLMAAGHAAYDADLWARRQFPAWAGAPRASVDAFSVANSRVWQAIAEDEPAIRMARAAAEWVRHRRS